MTLTFPRPLPDDAATTQRFEIERVDYLSPETGGRLGGVSAGWPLWRGVWTFSRGRRQTSEEWRALLSCLRGPQRTFFGRDYQRPFPLAYASGFAGLTRAATAPAVGAAFDGSATTWSLNGTRDALSLTGLPAGFKLSLNDYVMFRWQTGGNERRSLHRAVEAVTGAADGSLTVQIEPPVPSLVPVAAVADFANPVCVMKAVPGETRAGTMDRAGKIDGQLAGLQELLA